MVNNNQTLKAIALEIDLQETPAQLQQAIETELEKHGEPLRWAITAIDTQRQKAFIEAIAICE